MTDLGAVSGHVYQVTEFQHRGVPSAGNFNTMGVSVSPPTLTQTDASTGGMADVPVEAILVGGGFTVTGVDSANPATLVHIPILLMAAGPDASDPAHVWSVVGITDGDTIAAWLAAFGSPTIDGIVLTATANYILKPAYLV